ncbi:calcium-binding protein, partial [Chitinimonas sp. PSY-7]|uniref:calcium-binding protein n=1 Tax=Chitinimonas sp. PSY-7 TaxID=3459088 RepID=UPI00404008FA
MPSYYRTPNTQTPSHTDQLVFADYLDTDTSNDRRLFRDADNSSADTARTVEPIDSPHWAATTVTETTVPPTAGDDTIHGNSGADEIHGGQGNDNLYGGQGADTLWGDQGNDHLFGEGGDDQLNGGDGNDVLEGDDGNDRLSGNNGSNSLVGGAGNDVLIASDNVWERDANILEGGTGNDTLYGSYGDDTYVFNLGDGKDLLIETRPNEAHSNIPASIDTLAFGAGIALVDLNFYRIGNDMVVRHRNGTDEITIQNWFTNVVTDHFKLDKVVFADGVTLDLAAIEARTITLGTDQADVLMGYRSYADDIRAGAGNDKLFGFSGDDHLYGEDGNDTLMGGNGIAEQTGNDSLFGGAGNDNLFGEDGADVLSGDAGDDYLDGGLGDDLLQGGTGDDQLTGGLGNDRLMAGAGNDKYVFTGNWGTDVIDNTGGGNDWLFFTELDRTQLSFKQDGKDLIISAVNDASRSVRVLNHFNGGDAAIAYVQPKGGNALSATVIAQIIAAQNVPGGFETLIDGDANNNQLVGGATRDLLRGMAGNDTLFGGAGNDKLEGGDGADYLAGGYGNVANTGDDHLVGDAGSDTLVGEDGRDRMEGETGNDVYVRKCPEASIYRRRWTVSKLIDSLLSEFSHACSPPARFCCQPAR